MIVPYRNKRGYVIVGGVDRKALEKSLAGLVEENDQKKWADGIIPKFIYCHDLNGLKHIRKCAMCDNFEEFTIIGVKCNCKKRKHIPECYNKFINQTKKKRNGRK